jgi:hypothetical protein
MPLKNYKLFYLLGLRSVPLNGHFTEYLQTVSEIQLPHHPCSYHLVFRGGNSSIIKEG